MAEFDDIKDLGGGIWIPGDYSPLKAMPADVKTRKIKEAAKQDAEHNVPTTDSEELTVMEANIWERTVNGCGQLVTRFSSSVDSCLNSIRTKNLFQPTLLKKPKLTRNETSYADAIPELREKITSDITTSQEDIERLYGNYLDAKKILVNFQSDNGLNREAEYPESPVLIFGIISILALIETLLNGFMFRDVADGLAGGAFLALMLSLVNIGSGLILGFFGLRYLFSKNPVSKLSGAFFVMLFGVIGVLLNFLVAHYREIAADFDGFEPVLPVQSLLENPFGLESPEAFILLIFGFIVFIFSAYEGYSKISDKYPGYRNVDAKYRDAEYYLEDRIDEMREAVSEHLEAYRNDLEDNINREKKMVDDAKASLRKLATMRQEVLVSLDKCIADGNALLDVYRSENTKRRLGIAIPRFNEKITRDNALTENLSDMKDVETLVTDIEKTAQKNHDIYKGCITAAYAYGNEANEKMSDFVSGLKDKVAANLQLGRDVMPVKGEDNAESADTEAVSG